MKHEDAIVELSARHSQSEICELLGCSRNHVYKVQKKHGLAGSGPGRRLTMPTEKEEKIILELLPHFGVQTIGRMMGFTETAIQKVAKKHNFKRKPGESGFRYRLDPADEVALDDDILHQRDHGLQLGEKYKLPQKNVLRRARKLLGAKRFNRGSAPPLTSNFPMCPQTFEHLAELIEARCDRSLPPELATDLLLIHMDLSAIAEQLGPELFLNAFQRFRTTLIDELTKKRSGQSTVAHARQILDSGAWVH